LEAPNYGASPPPQRWDKVYHYYRGASKAGGMIHPSGGKIEIDKYC
jgi:hypothetical protein